MHMLEALTQETLVDDEPGLAAAYGIRSIPTLMVLRHGEPVARSAASSAPTSWSKALDRIARSSTRGPARRPREGAVT